MGGNWLLSPANHTTTCADEGCDKPARWFFEAGGAGSYHCDRLPLQLILGTERAAALSLLAEARAVLRDTSAWLIACAIRGAMAPEIRDHAGQLDAFLDKLDAAATREEGT